MAAQPTPPTGKPRAQDYPTLWSYYQARRVWLKGHGGRLWVTLLIAVFFGVLSGSAVALIVLVFVALLGTAYARSGP